ncbi:MAG: diguanylate cyclase [Candidatus Omnitrophota bacterium]|jgi:diguanylate cyclase (GGDEF)-like protein/PAS domain S-box-containing protein
MENKEIKILLIEDNKAEAEIIQKMLGFPFGTKFEVINAVTLTEGLELIEKNIFDTILLDLSLPDSIGLDTFGRVHAHAPKTPVIVITGYMDESQALMAFQKGAQDYLIKGQFDGDLLRRSIRYSIERNKSRLQLRDMQEKLQKVNNCFLGFGEDPSENICCLTAIFGEMLGAACALYNSLDSSNMLCSVGQWHVPEGYNPKDRPEGHICYDVITKGGGKMFLIRNLQDTAYAETDPNVKNYKLQTYLGYPIKRDNKVIGSLCAVYTEDFVPNEEDIKLMDIIAGAIEVEERRRSSKEELRESEVRYQTIFKQAADSLVVFDPQTLAIVDFNDEACRKLGYTREEFAKLKVSDFEVVESIEDLKQHCKDIVGGRMGNFETKHRSKSGAVLDIEVRARSVDIGGKKMIQGIWRDITERKMADIELERVNKELSRSNKKLNRLALKDPQTGLFNHKYLAEIMDSEFYRVKRYGGSLAIVIIDIDFFQSINDRYGYKFGDMILKQFAQQLRKMTRQYDIVIRYGGEEFIIVSSGANRAQALILAQRILDNIGIYNFGDKKNEVKLKLSMSVVAYPEDRANKAVDLMKIAEHVLAIAKEDGGNRAYSSADKKKGGKEAEERKIEEVNILRQRLEKLHKQANQNLIESIFAFAKTIELRDHYTGEHVEKTVKYATGIASALGLPRYDIDLIKQAAVLHDLGKVGISDKILMKKSKLNGKEMEEIKRHPGIAADILRPIHVLNAIIPFILHHHERWDGHGYPDGLKGEDIPLGARIIAIADVYQALISNRPYRKAFPKRDAIKIIEEGAGKQFDPKIVDIFVSIVKKEAR